MANGEAAIAHDTLDELPPGHRNRYFRRLLIEAGTLPPIHVLMHDLEIFIDSTVRTLSPANAGVLRRYTQWDMLPRLRRRYRDQDIAESAYNNNRSRIKVIVSFLTWLEKTEHPLAELDSATFEHYLVDTKGVATLSQFLGWAHRAGIVRDFGVYRNLPSARLPLADDQEIWRLVETLLADRSMELPVRIVGLLVLVFGQPVGRSVSLTRDRITDYDSSMTITFGCTPVELPAAIAALLREHLSNPAPRGYANGSSPWIFEGVTPGHHLSSSYVRLRLAEKQIHPRIARETRLDDLARILPASVIADVIGMRTTTADQRKARSAGKWATYPRLRG